MKKILTITLASLCFAAVSGAQVSDSLEVAKIASQNVESLLLGGVSGVDITSETGSAVSAVTTLIRGVNSLKTDSQPLWIVDGAILNDPTEVDNPFWQFGTSTYTANQSSMLGFNVYDIESITVLKDLSATALYGAKGANGVIIVNTRFPGKTRPVGLQWNSNLDVASMSHNHVVSLGGERNKTNYYISGYYKDFRTDGEDGQFGGFRFNFRSQANKALWIGLNASMSIGNDSALNPTLDPGADIDDNTSEYRTTDSFYMILNLGKSLKIKADVGMDYRVKRRYMWYGITTALGLDQNGAASISSAALFQYNASLNATFSRFFGKNHVELSAQADVLGGDPDYSVMCAYDFFDYTLRSKGISLGSLISTNRNNAWSQSTVGGYVRAAYDYNGIAGFDASVRADRNPIFDDGYVIYPSANAFLDLHKAFAPDCKTLSSLKVKGGWGSAGKEKFVPFQWTGDYSLQAPEIDIEVQAFYDGFFRSTSREYNVGAEFGFLSDRIRGEVKYYDKMTDESFRTYCFGKEFGENGVWRYVDRYQLAEEKGGISNRGIELDLAADIVKAGKFSWTLGFNGAYNINKVEAVPYLDNGFNALCDRWTNSNAVSVSAHQLIGYTLNEDGTIYDRTGNGTISPADQVYLGSVYPKYVFGVSTTLRYDRFTLEALVSGRIGSSWLDIEALLADDFGAEKALVTENYVRNGDVVRPSRVTLSYDVPLGKYSSGVGLKINLCAANPLPVFGYTAFAQKPSYIAGICLNF